MVFHAFVSSYFTWSVTRSPGDAGLTPPLILTLLLSSGSVLFTVALTLNAPALAAWVAWWLVAASAEARAVALLRAVARTAPRAIVLMCMAVPFRWV